MKASSTYSPGPQQPAISNDCALYVVWNMVWISFELHTPMLHNTHCGNITKKQYQDSMAELSNTFGIRQLAFSILCSRGNMLFTEIDPAIYIITTILLLLIGLDDYW